MQRVMPSGGGYRVSSSGLDGSQAVSMMWCARDIALLVEQRQGARSRQLGHKRWRTDRDDDAVRSPRSHPAYPPCSYVTPRAQRQSRLQRVIESDTDGEVATSASTPDASPVKRRSNRYFFRWLTLWKPNVTVFGHHHSRINGGCSRTPMSRRYTKPLMPSATNRLSYQKPTFVGIGPPEAKLATSAPSGPITCTTPPL